MTSVEAQKRTDGRLNILIGVCGSYFSDGRRGNSGQTPVCPFLAAELHRYLGGILRDLGGVAQEVGGVADHVHFLAALKATHCWADVLRDTKTGSSRWIHDTMKIILPYHRLHREPKRRRWRRTPNRAALFGLNALYIASLAFGVRRQRRRFGCDRNETAK